MGFQGGLWEPATVRMLATGKVVVLTGTSPHGQGEETTFAQMVADKLGVPVEDVDVVHGDTGAIPMGWGTYGSRSTAVGGTAIYKATQKVIEKAKKRRGAPARSVARGHRLRSRALSMCRAAQTSPRLSRRSL